MLNVNACATLTPRLEFVSSILLYLRHTFMLSTAGAQNHFWSGPFLLWPSSLPLSFEILLESLPNDVISCYAANVPKPQRYSVFYVNILMHIVLYMAYLHCKRGQNKYSCSCSMIALRRNLSSLVIPLIARWQHISIASHFFDICVFMSVSSNIRYIALNYFDSMCYLIEGIYISSHVTIYILYIMSSKA